VRSPKTPMQLKLPCSCVGCIVCVSNVGGNWRNGLWPLFQGLSRPCVGETSNVGSPFHLPDSPSVLVSLKSPNSMALVFAVTRSRVQIACQLSCVCRWCGDFGVLSAPRKPALRHPPIRECGVSIKLVDGSELLFKHEPGTWHSRKISSRLHERA